MSVRRQNRHGQPVAEILEQRQLLATITVNTTNDDDGTAGTTTLSLRQAIELSNGTLALSALTPAQGQLVVGGPTTPNTIDFDIPGTGPFTIEPTSALPAITSPVVIDGYSQPGAHPNANGPGQGKNTVLEIELDGAQAGARAAGLKLETGASTVRGLAIGGFSFYGVQLDSSSDLVEGNFVGTDVTGTQALPNGVHGIYSSLGFGSFSTIGGTTAGAGNLISGNAVMGLVIGVSDLVEGNFIGTDITGTRPIPNGDNGLFAPASDTIGGTTAGARNLVSGNAVDGLAIGDPVGTNNLVEGNFIGTDVTGSRPLPNGGNGINAEGSSSATIGGTAAGAGNVISGNTGDGVLLLGPSSLVEGNEIGTDAAGTQPLPNGGDGIGAAPYSFPFFGIGNSATIGGTSAGAANLISGNTGNGIALDNSDNLVEGNLIGTDISGTRPLPNRANGVDVSGPSNTIGGTAAGAGNLISGNTSQGIVLVGSTTEPSNILVEGNLIGTDITGTEPLPNGGDGIDDVSAPADNTIGGTTPGAGNVISGNQGIGLYLDADVGGDLIQGNKIGTSITGTSPLPNGGDGIVLDATLSTIGGTAAGAGNVISGNQGVGLNIAGATDVVEGNFIGTDVTGTIPISNGDDGIDIVDGGGNSLMGPKGAGRGGESNTIGGTVAGAGNLIADNQGNGISVYVGIEAQYQTLNIDGTLTSILTNYSVTLPNSGQFNTISGNSIFANQGLGIQLFNLHDSFIKTQGTSADYSLFTPTPGDPIGGNALLEAPTILSIVPDSATSSLSGTLSGAPSTTLTVEFFADPADSGQGKTYLGSTKVTTNTSGVGSFTFDSGRDLSGQYVTATATDLLGDTSEFSEDIRVPLATTTTLSVPMVPLYFGIPATFAATVDQDAGPVAAGFVGFFQGSVELGTAPVNASGVATFVTDLLVPGSEPITAKYLGSSNNASSVSTAASLFVQPMPTTTTLIGPSTPIRPGQQAVFTATETQIVGVPAPGFISFLDGGVVLATVPVGAYGVATFVTTSLRPGIHSITAAYMGIPTDAPSVSSPVSQSVLAGGASDGPMVTSTAVSSPNTVSISFSQPLLLGAARDIRDDAIVAASGGAVVIASAVSDGSNDTVTLTTRRKLIAGRSYRLTIDGLKVGQVIGVDEMALDGKHNKPHGRSFSGSVILVARAHPTGPKQPAHSKTKAHKA